jgi:hypothetical protein
LSIVNVERAVGRYVGSEQPTLSAFLDGIGSLSIEEAIEEEGGVQELRVGNVIWKLGELIKGSRPCTEGAWHRGRGVFIGRAAGKLADIDGVGRRERSAENVREP